MTDNQGRHAAGDRLRHSKWTGETGRGTGSAARARRFLATLAAVAAVASACLMSPLAIDQASAQRELKISGAKRTSTVLVPVGKTEDLRIDAPFTDITVGDPEVADVTPLTDRAISILGKKIGTTRVTVYAEGRRHVGIFDIEVSYDVSRLATEIVRVAGGSGIRVSSVNGRIMLSGTAPDAVTLDRAVTVARQFAPEIINSVVVASPQQVMLEVRFVEASRQAGRELGVQWNVFNSRMTANIGSRQPAGSSADHGADQPDQHPGRRSRRGRAVGRVAVRLHAWPHDRGRHHHRRADQRARAARPGAHAGGAQPGGAVGRYRKLPGRRRNPDPGRAERINNQISVEWKRFGVGLAFTPTVLNGGLINLKIEPEVSQIDPNNQVSIGAGLRPIPAFIVRRAATTIELRDGQSFMIGGLLQNESAVRPGAGSLARQPAGARPAVLQPLLPEEGDRPCHHRHAAAGAAGTAGLGHGDAARQHACRPTTRTSS